MVSVTLNCIFSDFKDDVGIRFQMNGGFYRQKFHTKMLCHSWSALCRWYRPFYSFFMNKVQTKIWVYRDDFHQNFVRILLLKFKWYKHEQVRWIPQGLLPISVGNRRSQLLISLWNVKLMHSKLRQLRWTDHIIWMNDNLIKNNPASYTAVK